MEASQATLIQGERQPEVPIIEEDATKAQELAQARPSPTSGSPSIPSSGSQNTPIASSSHSHTNTRKGKKGSVSERNVGKLAPMLKLPLNIQVEIYSHLHPLDLLHLCRVSKGFRKKLLSRRDAQRAWVSSLSSVDGLPECPYYMNEPVYSALLFDQYCFICGKAHSKKVDYYLNVRLCGECWSQKVHPGSYFMEKHPWIPRVAYESVPNNNLENRDYTEDMEHDRYLAFSDATSRCHYYEPEFVGIAESFVWNMESGSRYERPIFTQMMKEMMMERYQNGYRVTEWSNNRGYMKWTGNLEAQKSRKESIYKELEKLGYIEKDFPPHPSHDAVWDRLVNQPRRLTPRIWNHIKPQLIQCIERRK